jgi:hypothetical protein
MRLGVLAGAIGLGAVSLLVDAREARACGGCFHGPSQNGDVITDHRMIFRVTPEQTTLYDEIEYQGDPQTFAWVLPIHGPVQVGLSADVLFAALDQATATTVLAPSLPPCPSCGCQGGADAGAFYSGGGSGGSSGSSGGGVSVISQQVVGPYETVQLQSTDPNALTSWLQANGFAIPSDIDSVIAAYVTEGFDFLALKLQPNQGVKAMRPVRVTTQGAGLSLPLRMVAAGTGATVGITLWVIGDGRYEAANFGNFVIQPSDLVWNWNTEQSNFTTLRQFAEQAANFTTWQTESAMSVAPYRIEQPVLYGVAANDYLPIDAGDGGATTGETADQVRQDDLAALFPQANQGDVFVTRMRADLSHAALANDLNLQATTQTEISNVYQVTESVNPPACPAVPNPCPPCGAGSSSSGAGGRINMAGSSSGSSSLAQSQSGCSAVSTDGNGGWLPAALVGFVGFGIIGGRMRRRK